MRISRDAAEDIAGGYQGAEYDGDDSDHDGADDVEDEDDDMDDGEAKGLCKKRLFVPQDRRPNTTDPEPQMIPKSCRYLETDRSEPLLLSPLFFLGSPCMQTEA